MADIGMDLYLAYEDGYKKGKAETEAYLLHCGDETPVTNADRIRAMTDEELAEYLFDRGNGCEYCYGICAFQDECDEHDHAQEFCLEQIVRWLKQEVDDEYTD